MCWVQCGDEVSSSDHSLCGLVLVVIVSMVVGGDGCHGRTVLYIVMVGCYGYGVFVVDIVFMGVAACLAYSGELCGGIEL